MKQKYFDFVMDDLIENTSIKELEHIFINLNIKTVYVLRELKKKEDYSIKFILPKTSSNKIILKKAYLLKDPSLFHLYKEKEILFVESKSLKNNTFISTHKKIKFLKDPLSEKLSFDEQNARSCFQNKIKVVFDINLFRSNNNKSFLKQAIFIIPLLKKHKVDMIFSSFAKTKEDLVDFNIFSSFLKNFYLEEEIINRFLSKEILKLE